MIAAALSFPRNALGGLVAGVLMLMPAAGAMEIERVVSPGGIEAWLVEDHTNPLIAMEFAFEGGSVQDPAGKEGLARLVAATMDEGAGDLDSTAFQLRLEEINVRLSFRARGETFTGSLETLTISRDEAFDLLEMALEEPRFDDEPVERMRGQIRASLRRDETDPDDLLSRAFFAKLFPDHPYGKPNDGTQETLAAITTDDLRAYHDRVIAKDTLKIGVVGAISAEELGPILDEVFGDLPETARLERVADVQPETSGTFELVDADVPQSSILMALPGLKRDDPDFITAYVVNHIFGGGSFSSRLYREVREERGLVYSVYSYLYPLDHAAMTLVGGGTQNARVKEAVDVMRAEIEKMGAEGPSEEELDKAKRFLIGSYPLRFDTSDKIAGQLVSMQMDDLGIDYIDRRNGLIEAVTLEDARRVAAGIYDTDKLAIGIAGQPEGF